MVSGDTWCVTPWPRGKPLKCQLPRRLSLRFPAQQHTCILVSQVFILTWVLQPAVTRRGAAETAWYLSELYGAVRTNASLGEKPKCCLKCSSVQIPVALSSTMTDITHALPGSLHRIQRQDLETCRKPLTPNLYVSTMHRNFPTSFENIKRSQIKQCWIT